MRPLCLRLLAGLVLLAGWVPLARSADEPTYTRDQDVIYGRKFGTALTMDVFTPKKNANGAAVLALVSGGWFSEHSHVNPPAYAELLKRGYTVFAVVHGSQPKFTIPEAIADVKRAVRYIRHNAKKFHIDPERIGVTGGSAGGHLSLMLGTAGDKGNPKALDPVERASSRVQAVACFFPPTDFLNYGKKGEIALGRGKLRWLKAPFDFHDYDPKRQTFVKVTDEKKILEIGRKISPINHVSKESAPALIIHGDKDKIVPIQQAEIIVARLKEAGVPAELVVKKGADHGWPELGKDLPTLADWFDKYLKKKE